jgi:serine/threonine protein kinase
LVTPREALVVGESAVVVLELIDGSVLEDSMPVPDPRSVVAAVPAVVSGLAKVHAAGFVHRDVHPGNLILDASKALHLLDFGLVAPVGTRSSGAVGRFGYLSPEQARGEAVDGRGDVFAIGVVLWELVTGRRLHPPGNRASTLVEVATSVAPPVPGPFAEPIAAALCLAREERPDADSLWRMLQHAVHVSA